MYLLQIVISTCKLSVLIQLMSFAVHANTKFKYTWKAFHYYLMCISTTCRSRNNVVIETHLSLKHGSHRNNVVIETLKTYSTPTIFVQYCIQFLSLIFGIEESSYRSHCM